MAKFTEIFEDVTKKGVKIPSNLYLDTGLYPIIDQGQSAIAGYTNKADGLFFDVPAIIFGDHTRIFKYVEKPCFLGADGVKLLKAKKPNANHKYLYYALCNADIPNTGYNRHFKWLKEVDIPEYSEEEQADIVLKLDKISHLITLRKQQLAKLDELVKSQFVEMFGEPENNPKGFTILRMDDVVSFHGGSQPDKKYFEYEPTANNVRLIQIRDYRTDRYKTYIPRSLAKRHCNPNDIMIGRYGPPIFQIFKGLEGAYNVAMMKAVPKMGNREFIRAFLKQDCLRRYLEGFSKRTAGQDGIQMDKLKAYPFPYPPIELQDLFAAFVVKVDKLEFKAKASLEKLETLKKAMMQKYFN